MPQVEEWRTVGWDSPNRFQYWTPARPTPSPALRDGRDRYGYSLPTFCFSGSDDSMDGRKTLGGHTTTSRADEETNPEQKK